jgi:hypothetical protein
MRRIKAQWIFTPASAAIGGMAVNFINKIGGGVFGLILFFGLMATQAMIFQKPTTSPAIK